MSDSVWYIFTHHKTPKWPAHKIVSIFFFAPDVIHPAYLAAEKCHKLIFYKILIIEAKMRRILKFSEPSFRFKPALNIFLLQRKLFKYFLRMEAKDSTYEACTILRKRIEDICLKLAFSVNGFTQTALFKVECVIALLYGKRRKCIESVSICIRQSMTLNFGWLNIYSLSNLCRFNVLRFLPLGVIILTS